MSRPAWCGAAILGERQGSLCSCLRLAANDVINWKAVLEDSRSMPRVTRSRPPLGDDDAAAAMMDDVPPCVVPRMAEEWTCSGSSSSTFYIPPDAPTLLHHATLQALLDELAPAAPASAVLAEADSRHHGGPAFALESSGLPVDSLDATSRNTAGLEAAEVARHVADEIDPFDAETAAVMRRLGALVGNVFSSSPSCSSDGDGDGGGVDAPAAATAMTSHWCIHPDCEDAVEPFADESLLLEHGDTTHDGVHRRLWLGSGWEPTAVSPPQRPTRRKRRRRVCSSWRRATRHVRATACNGARCRWPVNTRSRQEAA